MPVSDDKNKTREQSTGGWWKRWFAPISPGAEALVLGEALNLEFSDLRMEVRDIERHDFRERLKREGNTIKKTWRRFQ
ncbi:hypothetical protein J2741_001531 [Methanolinea mesophila]|uniref:hypothetical protein n=1 Tax=Methanolinea mesophila TaxID=547055 RepID=UPI001AE4C93E|nr:hypothetical protein [Methanolinea mesophila]MBP1928984.1 hypothetical protein [Methanolinea mesophila]